MKSVSLFRSPLCLSLWGFSLFFLSLLLFSCEKAKQPVSLQFADGLVVNAENLNAAFSSDTFSIIDVRPEAEFLAGHIPGAVNIWRPQMADTSSDYSSITAPRAQLEKYFAALGLNANVPAVIYDHNKLTDASNLAWIFRLYGKKDAGVLDGGFEHWKQLGFATEAGPPHAAPTGFVFPAQDDSSAYASLQTMKAALADPLSVIVDVRTRKEYTGEDVRDDAKKGGRIPGSIWFGYEELLTEKDGSFFFKPAAEMEAILASKGITKDKKIYAYCQSGVRSANFTCILNSILHYPSIRNYDGSWEEWSAHDELPFETGEPGLAVGKGD